MKARALLNAYEACNDKIEYEEMCLTFTLY